MIPENDLLLKCPYCKVEMTLMSLISGNSGGSVKWSDGFIVMPMYPQKSKVQQSGECKHYFGLNKQSICEYLDTMKELPFVLTLSQWYVGLLYAEILDSWEDEIGAASTRKISNVYRPRNASRGVSVFI